MLKKLFYASASILMLALAYHLGATTATAQAPGNPIVGFAGALACTANGDVYGIAGVDPTYGHWNRVGNIFAGGPTPAAQPTFGQLKAQYRK